jgi:hypothetical protein
MSLAIIVGECHAVDARFQFRTDEFYCNHSSGNEHAQSPTIDQSA